ncbi:MAG TPA: Maf family nucleotide pyrophosphatase [Bacteroidales bacterium]|jgi:septum formation protein|nr:Maf family nucleotide pyrophosphatase [Bacteroidales bacterium]MDD4236034.1 Maf family nucleotide pyrophosphatase [Bacteroidales bacterium]MDY0159755.1 Maf family nucleotide pyrophosphatase [Bacteroidales bacterium]HRW20880.1 Maf family nucleotide pyrophosphatase [Bacteroidales bacterium]HXK82188.1 Maf family nucleotide pyrophosphatase [Bacteroidales bacterium]
MSKLLEGYQLVLGSKSPRRRTLLQGLNIPFTVRTAACDEHYPSELFKEDIAVFLAEKKAQTIIPRNEKEIVITADTIVWHNQEVLPKPINYSDAFQMLKRLSNNIHQVITGVHVASLTKQRSFYSITDVHFSELNDDEIRHYIETFRPYDKAGAYGIQEWIGYIGIKHISGSFYNVMGLPLHQIYEVLKNF